MRRWVLAAVVAAGMITAAEAATMTLTIESGPLYRVEADERLPSALKWITTYTFDTDDVEFYGDTAVIGEDPDWTFASFAWDGTAWVVDTPVIPGLPVYEYAQRLEYDLEVDQDFQLVSWDIALFVSGGVGVYDISHTSDGRNGISGTAFFPFGEEVYFTYEPAAPAPVPLPASALLLLGGVGALALGRRQR